MKKLAIVGVFLALTGCAEVENYNDVVKTPAPAGLEGYWQSKGPQRSLVSPEAIASLDKKRGRYAGLSPVAAGDRAAGETDDALWRSHQRDGETRAVRD